MNVRDRVKLRRDVPEFEIPAGELGTVTKIIPADDSDIWVTLDSGFRLRYTEDEAARELEVL